jgi:hypothetical protein
MLIVITVPTSFIGVHLTYLNEPVPSRGRLGRDRMLVDLQLPVQSEPITTKVVSLNRAHGDVYSIQNYVIEFVSDLRQISGFLRILVSSTN